MNQMVLEINPSSCVIFVGPQLFTTYFSYSSLLEAGIRLLGSEGDERGRLKEDNNLLESVKELDITLTDKKLKEQWLTDFLTLKNMPQGDDHSHGGSSRMASSLLQLLLDLQAQGCRLVYTFYDNYLDSLLGTDPILISNVSNMEKWLNGQLNGFFHIYGCITDISSIILHNYTTATTKEQHLFVQLKELFSQKSLIFIGQEFTAIHTLLIETVHLFLQEDSVIKNPPLFVSSLPHSSIPDCFLHLPITDHQEASLLHELIIISNDSLFMTGKVADKSTVDRESTRSQAVLVFSEKQSFRKLGDIIYHLNKSGEIYVRRDALTILFGTRIMYGNILTYGGKGLHHIWELILPKDSVLQNKGLVAIGLQSSCLIWIEGKPIGLGSITDVTTFHSLWNNSVTAINQSKPTTSSSPSLSPSSTLPPPPPLIPTASVVPFSPIFRGVATTPTATGNIIVSTMSSRPKQLILTTPTTSFSPTMMLTTGTNLPSIGTSLTGMGFSLPSIGMSPTNIGINLPNTGMNIPSMGINLPIPISSIGTSLPSMGMRPVSTIGTSTSSESSSMGMSPPHASECSPSSSSKRHDSESSCDLSRGAKLLKADPPLTIEDTCSKILSDYENDISVVLQNEPSPVLPTLINRLPTPTQQLPVPLLSYPRISFIPLQLGTSNTPFTLSPFNRGGPSTILVPGPTSFVYPFNNRLISTNISPTVTATDKSLSSTGTTTDTARITSVITNSNRLTQAPITISQQAITSHCTSPSSVTIIPLPNSSQVSTITGHDAINSTNPQETTTHYTVHNSTQGPTAATHYTVHSGTQGPTAATHYTVHSGTQGPTAATHYTVHSGTQGPTTFTGKSQGITTHTIQSIMSPSITIPQTTHHSVVSTNPPITSFTSIHSTGSTSNQTLISPSVAGALPPIIPPISTNSINHLWQFLLRLLLSPNHGHIVQWTGHAYEFCITNPNKLTEMWAELSQNSSLTTNGLTGELRSYSGLGILEKVENKEMTYQFELDIQTYLSINAGTLSKGL